MADDASEPDPTAAPGKPKSFFRSPSLIGAAAFILSLVLAAINIGTALRGSSVSIPSPSKVLIYRNGTDEEASLAIAVQLPMINTSSSYNDVLMELTMQVAGRDRIFRSEGLIRPIYNELDTKLLCARQETLCVPLGSLAVIDDPATVHIVPSGGANAGYFRFSMICAAGIADCNWLGNYRNTVAALQGEPITLLLEAKFFNDGVRRIRCVIPPPDAERFQTSRWQLTACGEATVTGNPYF